MKKETGEHLSDQALLAPLLELSLFLTMMTVDAGCLVLQQQHRSWDGSRRCYRSKWKASCLPMRSHLPSADSKDWYDELKSPIV